jgi:hypothetical protein
MTDPKPLLTPGAEWDWSAVSWGAPDELPTETCSYCDQPLGEEEMPLILWNDDHWCAQFCEACQHKHWGFEIFD